MNSHNFMLQFFAGGELPKKNENVRPSVDGRITASPNKKAEVVQACKCTGRMPINYKVVGWRKMYCRK